MIYLALLLAAVFAYFFQKNLYQNRAFENLDYTVSLSTSEVFEDEEIYMYEEIRNNKSLPIPFLKVDTELPDGLSFHIVEKDEKTGEVKDTYPRVIHSIFVLRGNQMIRRRWRIRCDVRGTYHVGEVTMIANDLFGSVAQVKVIVPEKSVKNCVVVLPKAINLEKEFTTSKYRSGDFIVRHSLLSDPLLKAGVRDYAPGDPINHINWLQTAVRGSLMTNVEEYTTRHLFNIIMNMQSRDIEQTIPGYPGTRRTVELCLSVVATILDNAAPENIPVRFISNTPPESFGDDLSAAVSEDDEIGGKIFVSPELKGKTSVIGALRLLAQLDLMISTPIEKMLDHILANPYVYTRGGNIVFVSSYLSERMIHFCYAMRKLGIEVIFYITSSNLNAAIIPDDIEVHFKTFVEE